MPITGWVDASTVIEPESEQVPSEGLGDIELPFPISPSRVVGDSMLPKDENGDVIVTYREQRSPLSSFCGRDRADADENVRTDAQHGKVSHASSKRGTALQGHAKRPAPAASDFQIARLMGPIKLGGSLAHLSHAIFCGDHRS